MSKNFLSEKAIASHGIEGAKFSLRGDTPGTAKIILYSKSIAYNSQVGKVDIFADNTQIGSVPSDMGFEGAYVTTAQDRDFEKDLGFSMMLDKALAGINLTSYKKVDLYYEYKELLESGEDYTVKIWLLNVEVGKPSVQQSTDANNITISDYSYPIKVLGDYIMTDASDPDAFFRDANGNKRKAHFMRSLPGVEGYESFENTAPKPVITPV